LPIYKTSGKKNSLQRYNVRINYVADNGKPTQLTRVAYGIDNAKILEMKILEQIKVNEEQPVKKMTVQQLFDEYIIIKKYEIKETSLLKIEQLFGYYILPIFKNCRIDKITPQALQEWKIFLAKKNLSLHTKKSAYGYFRAFINYAIKMEYIHKNPLTKIGNFKEAYYIKPEMNFYTPDEFKVFISKAKEIAKEKEQTQNDLSEWNYYVFFNIAFYTGLRKGEIHALKWTDINGEYLSVKRSLTQRLNGGLGIETTPKTASSIRTLQMPLPLIKILEKQKARQQLLHNFTDDFRITNNIRNGSIDRRNKNYSTWAGIKTIRIHDFRHSHASLLANCNINIQEVSRRLGHARIEMTWNTYCHLYPKEEEKAVSILNSFVY